MHWLLRPVFVLVILALVGPVADTATTLGLDEPTQDVEQRFRAFAAVVDAGVKGRSSRIEIVITRWTKAEENERLLEILEQGGQNAFRRALQDQELTGWVRLPSTTRQTRQELRYAWERTHEETGGREIILATDDIIPFDETWNPDLYSNPHVLLERNLTLIQMELDENDEGAGTAVVGEDLTVRDGHLTVQDLGANPVILDRIQRTN